MLHRFFLTILTVLTIIFVLSCDEAKMMMPTMTETDAEKQDEEPFSGIPRINVSDAIMQDKIAGPWLWMIAPTERGEGGANSIDVDSLAIISDGVVTETDIATHGAKIGDIVGNLAWTLGTISAAGENNVNDVINEIGLGKGDLDHYTSYALIVIVSDVAQSELTMRVGSDDAIKVWLNSQVVFVNAINRGSTDFQDEFKVDLKKGNNLLCVKVSERTRDWTMFVGIESNSETERENM